MSALGGQDAGLVAERDSKIAAHLLARPPWWRLLRLRAWSRELRRLQAYDVSVMRAYLRSVYPQGSVGHLWSRPVAKTRSDHDGPWVVPVAHAIDEDGDREFATCSEPDCSEPTHRNHAVCATHRRVALNRERQLATRPGACADVETPRPRQMDSDEVKRAAEANTARLEAEVAAEDVDG